MKTYFRSLPVYKQSPSLIDRESGIIKDIVLCQVGEAKGHDLFIDQDFINNVITFGNQNHGRYQSPLWSSQYLLYCPRFLSWAGSEISE